MKERGTSAVLNTFEDSSESEGEGKSEKGEEEIKESSSSEGESKDEVKEEKPKSKKSKEKLSHKSIS